jgi:hypothetical protein
VYRTGDRARLTADGLIEFVGRADDQVKIRGYRVEPGEVGCLLAGLPAVREAVVLALPLDSDAPATGGYVVAEAGVTEQQLLAQLQARLPEYMVPAQMLLLERLPLTANGKLDKRALPAPGAVSRGFVAPQGEIEEKLAAVWPMCSSWSSAATTSSKLGGDSILSASGQPNARAWKIPPSSCSQQTIAYWRRCRSIEAAASGGARRPSAARCCCRSRRGSSRWMWRRAHWNQSVLLNPPARTLQQLEPPCVRVEQHDALRLRFTVAMASGGHASSRWAAHRCCTSASWLR